MSKKIREAIGALADLFEFGHPMADTQPIAFLGEVVLEVTGLRARVADLERELAAAREEERNAGKLAVLHLERSVALRAAIDAAVVELEPLVDGKRRNPTRERKALSLLRAAQKAGT